MNDSRKQERKRNRETARLYFFVVIVIALIFAGLTALAFAIAELSQGTIMEISTELLTSCMRTIGSIMLITVICPLMAIAAIYYYKSRKH